MAKAISNVVISTDTFASWIAITNEMADTFTFQALTANTSANGAQVTGNSAIIGIFAGTTLTANNLRGGTVANSANLTVTSNVHVTGGDFFKSSANIFFDAANTYINSLSTAIIGGSLSVTSNLAFAADNASIVAVNTAISGGNVSLTSNLFVTVANVTINATQMTIRAGALNINSSVSVSNTVSVTGNVTVNGGLHSIDGNVAFDTSTLFIDSVNNRVGILNTAPNAVLTVGGTANIAGNTSLAGILNVVGNTTVNGIFQVSNTALIDNTLTLRTEAVFDVVTNTNIGNANTSGTFIPVDILTITKPVPYKSAKITASVYSANLLNVQTQELILAHSNTANDVTLTAYGTVAAPASANLGLFTAAINSTALALKFTQTSANSGVKLLIQYIK
jgi:hypothetical protein